jgi:hypothetical protein
MKHETPSRQVIQDDSTLQKQVNENELPVATFPSPGTSNTDVSPLRRLRNKRGEPPERRNRSRKVRSYGK